MISFLCLWYHCPGRVPRDPEWMFILEIMKQIFLYVSQFPGPLSLLVISNYLKTTSFSVTEALISL